MRIYKLERIEKFEFTLLDNDTDDENSTIQVWVRLYGDARDDMDYQILCHSVDDGDKYDYLCSSVIARLPTEKEVKRPFMDHFIAAVIAEKMDDEFLADMWDYSLYVDVGNSIISGVQQ